METPDTLTLRPIKNTLGGKTYPCLETISVQGIVSSIERSEGPFWILELEPKHESVIERLQSVELRLRNQHGYEHHALRSCIVSDSKRVRAYLPVEPKPPHALREGVRGTFQLSCSGFHVFLEDCGITWRIYDVVLLHRDKPTFSLFSP